MTAGTYAFDEDTSVAPLAGGQWRAVVSPRWNIGDKPNGGYVLACVVGALRREAEAEAGKPDPLTMTAHYLRPVSTGPAEISTELVRSGRRHAYLAGRLVQGTERVRVLAVFGELSRPSHAAPTFVRGAPPDLPPPEECLDPVGLLPEAEAPAIVHRFQTRFPPETAWLRGERSATTVIAGWIRFADERPVDVAALPLFADAFPPAVLALGARAWVPTIELTVHVRARPAPGWLRCRFETRFLVDGYLEEDGEIWDADGRLVAQSRQLAMLQE